MSEPRPDTPPPGAPAAGRGPVLSRRRALAAAAAVATAGPVLAACSSGSRKEDDATQALLALADAARMDAAMVVAAVTATPALAGRLEPLRAARMEHANALDQAGGRAPDSVPAAATPPRADLAAVRDSVSASAGTAGQVVLRVTAQQVGLVAEVAAYCSTYAAVLR